MSITDGFFFSLARGSLILFVCLFVAVCRLSLRSMSGKLTACCGVGWPGGVGLEQALMSPPDAAETPRSMILTSGTLSPMDSFASELRLPFPVRLENPHVIPAKNVWVGVVSRGPLNRPLNSSFKFRGSADYVNELGAALVNFARVVPDGGWADEKRESGLRWFGGWGGEDLTCV